MTTSTTKDSDKSPGTKTKFGGAAKSGAKTKPEIAKAAKLASVPPKPKLVEVGGAVVGEADMKKKELFDLVVERCGVKKKDAKPAIEATLAILGEAIASGRELNLPPMGKLRINRSEDKANGQVIVCKLRRAAPGAAAERARVKAEEATVLPAADPLAEPVE